MSNDLEARVAKLEAAVFKGGGANRPAGDERLLGAEQLAQPWANKEVRKDPKYWKGDSYVGKTYSQCPAEYLDKMAESLAYKASMERQDNPPKLQTSGKNAGKPWYESTEFEAKIVRSWAANKRATVADNSLPGDSEEIPF